MGLFFLAPNKIKPTILTDLWYNATGKNPEHILDIMWKLSYSWGVILQGDN